MANDDPQLPEKEDHEPFEYVAYFDYQPRPGRHTTELASTADGSAEARQVLNDVEMVLVCILCGHAAYQAGRLVERVTRFPKGRSRRCESCGGTLKRPVLDPFFTVRDHQREKEMALD